VSLYMGFNALCLEHYLLHAMCQMFYDVEYCDVGNSAGIRKQQPHYFHCRNYTKCMSAYSSFVNVCRILITPLYCNTAPSASLDSVQGSTRTRYSIAVLAHVISM
jgi:hypothetical protein